MSSLVFKFTLFLFAVFAVVLLLIRAQPRDDGELRTLLLPNDCEQPCFMGIQPGKTTANEAVKLLEASGWVKNIHLQTIRGSSTIHIEWGWNGLQPSVIDGSWPGVISAYALETVQTGISLQEAAHVNEISIASTLRYGDLHLIMGSGTNGSNYVFVGRFISSRIIALYADNSVTALSASLPCPVSLSQFWNSIIELHIGNSSLDGIGQTCPRMA